MAIVLFGEERRGILRVSREVCFVRLLECIPRVHPALVVLRGIFALCPPPSSPYLVALVFRAADPQQRHAIPRDPRPAYRGIHVLLRLAKEVGAA